MSGPSADMWAAEAAKRGRGEPEWKTGELTGLVDPPAARAPKRFAELARRHASLFFAWRTAVNQHKADLAALDAARAADDHARAQALVAGKTAPKPTVPAAQARADQSAQAADDYRRALVLLEGEIRGCAVTEAVAWHDRLDADAADADAEIAALLDRVGALLADRDTRRRVRKMLAAPHSHKAWKPWLPRTDEADALDSLRAALLDGADADEAGDQADELHPAAA